MLADFIFETFANWIELDTYWIELEIKRINKSTKDVDGNN